MLAPWGLAGLSMNPTALVVLLMPIDFMLRFASQSTMPVMTLTA